MQKIFITIVISLLVFTLFHCSDPAEPPEIDTLADSIVFSIPDSMTGDGGGSRSIRVSQGTINTIDSFYNYVRYQIWYTHLCAQFIKDLVSALEDENIFENTEGFEAELTGDNAGDILKWTKNSETDYLLEWWKLQDDMVSFKKFVELQFNYYEKDEDGYITARGWSIVNVNAVPNYDTWPDYSKNADLLKIEFDSDLDGTGVKWMKVSVSGFRLAILDEGDTQNCIIEASKDQAGVVTIAGVTRVPGISSLNREGDSEIRYYVYSGKGTEENATVNLGMPLTEYILAEVFNFENAVGGVISEWISDSLRLDDDFPDVGITGHQILDYMDATSENVTFTTPYTNNSGSEIPSTQAIIDAVNEIYSEGDDLHELMNIQNPAYFQSGGYVGYGNTPPDDDYPDPEELPATNTLPLQDDIDSLSIIFNPDDPPPDL